MERICKCIRRQIKIENKDTSRSAETIRFRYHALESLAILIVKDTNSRLVYKLQFVKSAAENRIKITYFKFTQVCNFKSDRQNEPAKSKIFNFFDRQSIAQQSL